MSANQKCMELDAIISASQSVNKQDRNNGKSYSIQANQIRHLHPETRNCLSLTTKGQTLGGMAWLIFGYHSQLTHTICLLTLLFILCL